MVGETASTRVKAASLRWGLALPVYTEVHQYGIQPRKTTAPHKTVRIVAGYVKNPYTYQKKLLMDFNLN